MPCTSSKMGLNPTSFETSFHSLGRISTVSVAQLCGLLLLLNPLQSRAWHSPRHLPQEILEGHKSRLIAAMPHAHLLPQVHLKQFSFSFLPLPWGPSLFGHRRHCLHLTGHTSSPSVDEHPPRLFQLAVTVSHCWEPGCKGLEELLVAGCCAFLHDLAFVPVEFAFAMAAVMPAIPYLYYLANCLRMFDDYFDVVALAESFATNTLAVRMVVALVKFRSTVDLVNTGALEHAVGIHSTAGLVNTVAWEYAVEIC